MTEQHNRTGPNRTEQNSKQGTEQKTEQAGSPSTKGPAVRFDVPRTEQPKRPVRLFGAGLARKSSKTHAGIKASVALAHAVAPAMREHARRERALTD